MGDWMAEARQERDEPCISPWLLPKDGMTSGFVMNIGHGSPPVSPKHIFNDLCFGWHTGQHMDRNIL